MAVKTKDGTIHVRLTDDNMIFCGKHNGREWVGDCVLWYTQNIYHIDNIRGPFEAIVGVLTGLLRKQLLSTRGVNMRKEASKYDPNNPDHIWVTFNPPLDGSGARNE